MSFIKKVPEIVVNFLKWQESAIEKLIGWNNERLQGVRDCKCQLSLTERVKMP